MSLDRYSFQKTHIKHDKDKKIKKDIDNYYNFLV